MIVSIVAAAALPVCEIGVGRCWTRFPKIEDPLLIGLSVVLGDVHAAFWTTTFQDRIILYMCIAGIFCHIYDIFYDTFYHRGGPKREVLIWILTFLTSRGCLKVCVNPIISLISEVQF